MRRDQGQCNPVRKSVSSELQSHTNKDCKIFTGYFCFQSSCVGVSIKGALDGVHLGEAILNVVSMWNGVSLGTESHLQ